MYYQPNQRRLKELVIRRDTPDGARASTVIFTILETAKANGLNPEKYIGHLLTLLPELHSANDPKPQIDDLLPWADRTLLGGVWFIDRLLPISNNAAENAIRPFVIGRKNCSSANPTMALLLRRMLTAWLRLPKPMALMY